MFSLSLTHLSASQIDCDKTIMVTLKHDDKLQDGLECAFQVQVNFWSGVCNDHFLKKKLYEGICLIF
jgi:hypothetical protein